MLYVVTKNDGEKIHLQTEQVLNLIAAKVTTEERPRFDNLGLAGIRLLESNQALSDVNLKTLLSLGIVMGYYYHIFLSTNEVEIQGEEIATPSDESGSAPSD